MLLLILTQQKLCAVEDVRASKKKNKIRYTFLVKNVLQVS